MSVFIFKPKQNFILFSSSNQSNKTYLCGVKNTNPEDLMNNPLHTKKISMRTLFFALSFLLSLPLFAQQQRAGFTLSAASGLLPTYLKDQANQELWPVAISAGYRFKGLLSLNLYAGHSIATSDIEIQADKTPVRYRNSTSIVGLKAALHTTRFERVDVYGGSMLALYRSNIRQLHLDGSTTDLPKTNEPSATKPYQYGQPDNKILVTAFVGASYYANQYLSIFAEAGWGISTLQAGLRITL